MGQRTLLLLSCTEADQSCLRHVSKPIEQEKLPCLKRQERIHLKFVKKLHQTAWLKIKKKRKKIWPCSKKKKKKNHSFPNKRGVALTTTQNSSKIGSLTPYRNIFSCIIGCWSTDPTNYWLFFETSLFKRVEVWNTNVSVLNVQKLSPKRLHDNQMLLNMYVYLNIFNWK